MLWEAQIHILYTVFLAHVVHLHILLMHFKDISVLFGLILFWDSHPREITRVTENDLCIRVVIMALFIIV